MISNNIYIYIYKYMFMYLCKIFLENKFNFLWVNKVTKNNFFSFFYLILTFLMIVFLKRTCFIINLLLIKLSSLFYVCIKIQIQITFISLISKYKFNSTKIWNGQLDKRKLQLEINEINLNQEIILS